MRQPWINKVFYLLSIYLSQIGNSKRKNKNCSSLCFPHTSKSSLNQITAILLANSFRNLNMVQLQGQTKKRSVSNLTFLISKNSLILAFSIFILHTNQPSSCTQISLHPAHKSGSICELYLYFCLIFFKCLEWLKQQCYGLVASLSGSKVFLSEACIVSVVWFWSSVAFETIKFTLALFGGGQD